jgi:hypothetical protein
MTWQPGDPLWIDHAGTQCTRPIFQLVGDQGGWDGASWPMPASIWDLGEGDELGVFIGECKQMEGAA